MKYFKNKTELKILKKIYKDRACISQYQKVPDYTSYFLLKSGSKVGQDIFSLTNIKFMGMYEYEKEKYLEFKLENNLDFFAVQIGYFLTTFDDSSEFLKVFFNYKISDGLKLTGIPLNSPEKFDQLIEKLNYLDKTYAISLGKEKIGNKEAKIITHSSNENIIGEVYRFIGEKKSTKSKNLAYESLHALREGINPVTGEIFQDSSPWKNNKIKEDIEEIINFIDSEEWLTKQRTNFSNAYKPWSDLEDKKLTELFNENNDIKFLSEYLQRTPGSIRSRLEKLQLK